MNLLLIVAALVCFIVAGLLDAGWLIAGTHWPAWVAFGLAFLAASHLVGAWPGRQP